MKRRAWLSCLLALAMLLSCFAVITVSASAAGAEYPNDEAAIEAGYVFCVDEKYYQTLADAYKDVPENGTIEMIADYTNYTNSTDCENVGADATEVKTFTINGNNHTYTTDKNHGLHFHNANVTVDGMNYKMTGEGAGARVEYTSVLTLKNCTWEKTNKSANAWSPAMIVYGTLIMERDSVLKNNNEKSDKQSNGIWTEGKKPDGTADKSIVPKIILKENATVEAYRYVFYEKANSEIEIQSTEVTLISPHADNLPIVRRINAEDNPDSVLKFAGPTDEDYQNPEAKAAWKNLYTQMAATWFDTPNVDKETILSYKPDMGAASVRMKEDSYGLRFNTTVSADVVNFAKALVEKGTMTSFSYGTLIVRYDDIRERTDLSAETLTAAGVKFIDVKADKGLKENKDGSVSLSTAMVNIKEANYGVKFCAISYITYVYADTTLGTVTAYADPSEASSIADAAWRALADVTENLNSENTNPLHSYWKLENGEYVEVDGDVYTKYSKAQRETLLAFTSLN